MKTKQYSRFTVIALAITLFFTSTALRAQEPDRQDRRGPGGQKFSFGNDGWTALDYGSEHYSTEGDMVASGNDIYVCGQVNIGNSALPQYIRKPAFLTHFNDNGVLDASWGSNGVIAEQFGDAFTGMWYKMLIQKNGKIIVVGDAVVPTSVGNLLFAAMLRYNRNGSIDTTFRTKATALAYLGNASYFDITEQADGKFLTVAAYTPETGSSKMTLQRWSANGEPDRSFGKNGQVARDIPFIAPQKFPHIKVNKDGDIFVFTETQTNVNLIQKFTSKGENAEDWGIRGALRIVFSRNPTLEEIVNDFLIDDAGRLVFCGSGNFTGDPDLIGVFLARLLPNGDRDASFGDSASEKRSGVSGIFLPITGAQELNSVTLQGEGRNSKLIATGIYRNSLYNLLSHIMTIRWEADGTIDTSWGDDGVDTASGFPTQLYDQTITNGFKGIITSDSSSLLVLGRNWINKTELRSFSMPTLSEYRLKALVGGSGDTAENNAAVKPPAQTAIGGKSKK